MDSLGGKVGHRLGSRQLPGVAILRGGRSMHDDGSLKARAVAVVAWGINMMPCGLQACSGHVITLREDIALLPFDKCTCTVWSTVLSCF